MNAFVRRLAVLSVLWAAVEILLPHRRQQPAIRMTMGLLVVTALVSQTAQWLGAVEGMPAWIVHQEASFETKRLETTLHSWANQVEDYCVRQAEKAGYQAEAGVWIRRDGSVERIELRLLSGETVLLNPEKLRDHLSDQLKIAPECICLEGI